MNGASRITMERYRQRQGEGFDAERDSSYRDGELLRAAICYANYVAGFSVYSHDQDLFPWSEAWDKRGKVGEVRLLEMAGALIAAEIDRRVAKGEAGVKNILTYESLSGCDAE